MVLFLNGASGDVNPRIRGSFRDARILGTRLAGSATDALAAADSVEVAHPALACKAGIAVLPFDLSATRRRARAYVRLKEDGDRGVRAQREWGERILSADARGCLRSNLRAPVQAMRIGPVCLGMTPCELLTRVGFDIRRRARRPDTWMVSCANGDIGYVAAAEDVPRGGYEVDGAHLYYDSPQLGRSAGRVLACEAARLIRAAT